MATSNSWDFTVTRDDIIKESLRICQVLGLGESPSATATNECTVALNILIKALAGKGLPLFAIKTTNSLALVASTGAYTIGPGATFAVTPAPARILQAWVRNTQFTPNYDQPLRIATREEFNGFPQKLQTGTPTSIYYDQAQLTSGYGGSANQPRGTVNIWPAPDSSTATNYTLSLSYQTQLEDFDASTDNLGMPQEWYEAIIWRLATRLSYYNGLPFAERSMIKNLATEMWDEAAFNGAQEGSLFVYPDIDWNRL